MIRAAVLWSQLSGYLVACLNELAARGVEILVVHWPASTTAPFRFSDSDLVGMRFARDKFTSYPGLQSVLLGFRPDAALISGWMDRMYLRAALDLRSKGCVVIGAIDNQWRGDWKQLLGSLSAGWLLRKMFSAVWVPGDRAEQFARRLGFEGVRLWRGLYCGATRGFREIATLREQQWMEKASWPRKFVFVGRYEDVKGLRELLRAYQAYRDSCPEPWELICVGHGNLKPLVAAARGVQDLGFVQPRDLPSILADAGCFVLPSRKEGWVVALLEAAASGLPVICSDACGSHVELVRDGYNGCIVSAGNVEELVMAMRRVSMMAPADLREWGRRSAQLAAAYTPERWADYFLQKYQEITS